MAGILDSKERLIDFVFTSEGKRQASTGQMKPEYATVTDLHVYYGAVRISGSMVADDASSRVYFEAHDRYQDTIVPELEAGTAMRPFRTSDFSFTDINVISGSFRSGPDVRGNVLSGSDLLNQVTQAIGGIANNFRDQRILATEDLFSNTEGFELYPTSYEFSVRNDTIFNRSASGGVMDANSAPSVFADERFSHLPNFRYMPPINVPTLTGEEGNVLGNYPKLRSRDEYTLQELKDDLAGKQYVELNFSKTSRDNNLLGQWFESSTDGIEKLSIIDFGTFDDDSDVATPPLHVFFVGRIIKDARGTETFSNIFTVVSE